MNPLRDRYVRELNLPYLALFRTGSRIRDAAVPPDDNMLKFIDAGQKLGKLYPGPGPEPVPESEDLANEIENLLRLSSRDAIVVVLLHYLPFLKTIICSIERMGGEGGGLF